MAFEWNGATISAKAMTIGDEEKLGTLVGKLTGTPSGRYRFAEFQAAALIDGDSPVRLLREDDPAELCQAAYEEWRKLPRKFLALWTETLNGVENATKNG
jgi:hypothetical protein